MSRDRQDGGFRGIVQAERVPWVDITIGVFLLLMFLLLAVAVSSGQTHAFEVAILEFFRVPGNPQEMIGSYSFREAVRDVTALGSFSLLAVFSAIVIILLIILGQRGPALFMLFSVLSGAFLSEWLKTYFARPRPEFSTIAQELSASFPSGHAMLSATVFLTIGALLSRFTTSQRLQVFFFATAILLTVAVGVTRVMLGVHFPSDVLAGWVLGAVWAILSSAAAYRILRESRR